MARKARIKSSTGIYHVLVRAISNLSLFTDEKDAQYYTNILNDLQLQGRCEVYAYALFPTHVHLLIREGVQEVSGVSEVQQVSEDTTINHKPSTINHKPSTINHTPEPIGSVMKRVASAYSYYFNVKFDHYGPIYLDRFKSNPVETKDYYLKVLDHIGSKDTQWKYTCRHIPSGLPKESSLSSSLSLLDFHQRKARITDSRLMAFLQQTHSFTNVGEFLQRDITEQAEVIRSCKKYGGSIRQIVRLTGQSYSNVFRIKTDS